MALSSAASKELVEKPPMEDETCEYSLDIISRNAELIPER